MKKFLQYIGGIVFFAVGAGLTWYFLNVEPARATVDTALATRTDEEERTIRVYKKASEAGCVHHDDVDASGPQRFFYGSAAS